MRPLARWGTLPLLGAPMATWALGLGDIELNSALNQPLDAEIELVSATPEELAGLNVTLASPAVFERYGLERPGFLSSLQFQVGRDAAGNSVIRVTSTQSIAEPFVTMLVEATTPRSRLMREYTVFLDPPVLLDAPAPEPVRPPETRTPDTSVAGGAIPRPEPRPAPTAAPPAPAPVPAPTATPSAALDPLPAPPTPAPRPAPAAAVNASPEGSTTAPVQRGQTLWGIASNYRPAGITMNQMMLAIYEANREAFIGNMNLLRRGAILRIPPAADLGRLTAANATAEVQRQIDEWQGRTPAEPRPQLVLRPASEQAGGGAVAGGSRDSGADAAEVTSLRNEVSTLRNELEESQRLLEVRNSELANLQQQLDSETEAQAPTPAEPESATTVDPGVELESEQLFVDESADAAGDTAAGADATAVASLEPAETAAPAETETPVEAEAAPVAPPPAPSQQVVTTPPAPSLVQQILGWIMSPLALIGGGIAAVLVAALLFLRRRRDEVEDVTGQWDALEAEIEEDAEAAATARIRAKAEKDDDFVVVENRQAASDEDEDDLAASSVSLPAFDSGTAELNALTEPEPAEQTMTSQTMSSQTVINLDQADPMAEADFHMAYGLYDQAADLVSKALEADPGNRELKLKLLEVYFVWGNKESFLETATSLREEMGGAPDADWDKVVIMGKQICPDEELFAEARAAAGEVDLALDAGEAEQGLDFAFNEEEDDAVDLDLGSMDEADMELETTGTREEVDLDVTGKRQGLEFDELSGDDGDDDSLDIGAQTSAGLEAALFETDTAGEETSPDLSFDDLAATQESPTIETKAQGSLADDEDEDDWGGITMESPTIEQAGPEAATVETPSFEDDELPTMESPTIEQASPASAETVAQAGPASADLTAELELDDLGLDVSDLDDLPGDLGDLPAAESSTSDTREQPAIDADDDLLSATGVTQVLQSSDDDDDAEYTSTAIISDDEATMMAPGFGFDADDDDEATGIQTEVLEQQGSSFPGSDQSLEEAEDDLDLNLDDLTQALEGADTVEQPRASSFGTGMFESAGTGTPVDLDIGADIVGDDDPTGTEEAGPLDPQTMTEVGTKLDLARAYIDMGDPEGAKSILEEVLSEGDSSQRREAQSLIDALPA